MASWLLDLTAAALAAGSGARRVRRARSATAVKVAGRSTQPIDEGVPVPVLSSALFARFSSRGRSTIANKVLSAMRTEFGGHEASESGQEP